MASQHSTPRSDDEVFEAARQRAEKLAVGSGLKKPQAEPKPPSDPLKSPWQRYREIAFEPLDGSSGFKRAFAAFNFSLTLIPFLAAHATIQEHNDVIARYTAQQQADKAVTNRIQRPPPGLSFDTLSAGCRIATVRFVPLAATLTIIYGVEYNIRLIMFGQYLRTARETISQARADGNASQADSLEQQLKQVEGRTPNRGNMISRGVAGGLAGAVVGSALRALQVPAMPRAWWAVPGATLGLALGAQVLPDWERLPAMIGGGSNR